MFNPFLRIHCSRVAAFGLLLAAFLLAGCNEAIVQADNDNLPDIPDGEGTPWVEFTSADDPVGEPGDVIELEIQPGVAVEEEITVTYEVSGDAVAGTDYQIVSGGSPVVIPFTFDDNNLDEAVVEVEVLGTATDGRTLTVTLTGASSPSFPTFNVGRGDDPDLDFDRTRMITIAVP